MSRKLAEAHRRVLRASQRGAKTWSERATRALADLVAPFAFVPEHGTVVWGEQDGGAGDGGVFNTELHVYTFAGDAVNRTLARALHGAGFDPPVVDGLRLRVKGMDRVGDALREARATWVEGGVPAVEVDAEDRLVRGLKFGRLLPGELAAAVVARGFDGAGVVAVAGAGWEWEWVPG